MHAHARMSSFPDPSSNGTLAITPSSGIEPASLAFEAAQKACGGGPSNGGPPQMSEAQRLAALHFSECMRSHTVPNFPDPANHVSAGAGRVLSVHGMLFAGTTAFNPRAAGFKHAAVACGVKLPWIPRRVPVLLAAVGCGLVVAACGGASHKPATTSNRQFALAQCMRSHGVSNFPDPNPGGGFSVAFSPGGSTLSVDGITFSGPAFESAVRTCKFFGGGDRPAPISAGQQQQMFAKARCIRTHGVPNFPDPTFGPGGEGAGIKLGPGDNPESPAFRRAARACAHVGTNIPGVGLG